MIKIMYGNPEARSNSKLVLMKVSLLLGRRHNESYEFLISLVELVDWKLNISRHRCTKKCGFSIVVLPKIIVNIY